VSSIVIKGNTSGQVEIAAPDVAGSTTLTLPTGTGTVLLSDGDGSALTGITTGKVLQVVQTTFTGTQTVTTPSHGYFTNITNLSASITPSSTSSKILIMLNVNVMHPNDRIIHAKMSGGNSASFIANAASNRARAASSVTGQNYTAQMLTLTYLDSPNTTSSTTYTPQMGGNYTGTTWAINYNVINDSDVAYITRSASSMILMEIAG
jgi:hypothetical protein